MGHQGFPLSGSMASLTATISVNGNKKEFTHDVSASTGNCDRLLLIEKTKQLQNELNSHFTVMVEKEKASNGSAPVVDDNVEAEEDDEEEDDEQDPKPPVEKKMRSV